MKLLVGGREHCTTRATLSLVTGSFLDRLVNQEDEGGMAALDDGRFFIDRDGDIFALVLDYLRTAGVSVPEYDPETLRRAHRRRRALPRLFRTRARAPSLARFRPTPSHALAPEAQPRTDPLHPHADSISRTQFYGLEDLARQCDENLAALERERGREKEPVVVRVLQQSNAAAAAEEETDAPPMPLKRRRSEAVEALGEDVFGADDF